MQIQVTRIGNTDSPLNIGYSVTGTGARPAEATDFAGGALPAGSIIFAVGESVRHLHLTLALGAVVGRGVSINIEGTNIRPSGGALLWAPAGEGWRANATIFEFGARDHDTRIVSVRRLPRQDGRLPAEQHDYVVRDSRERPAGYQSPDGVLAFGADQLETGTPLKALFSTTAGRSPLVFVFNAIGILAWTYGPLPPLSE